MAAKRSKNGSHLDTLQVCNICDRPDVVAATRRLDLAPALHPEHRVRPESAQPVQSRPHGERPPARVDVLGAREVAARLVGRLRNHFKVGISKGWSWTVQQFYC